jgi:hypothetical protein
MPEEKGGPTQDTQKAKVVLVRIEKEKDRYEVVKVLANQLAISFEEAGEILAETPVELIPSIPTEAGEQFAEKLREVGADVEVLPIGKAAGHFCSTHPHRRARARCKEPGCPKYICEICIIESKGKLLCPDCYARYRRRRWFIGIGSVAGLFLALWVWVAFGVTIKRWINHLYVDTQKVAIVLTAREMTDDLATYFMQMSTTDHPGEFITASEHKLPDIDGWFQREFQSVTEGEIDILEVDTYGLFEVSGAVPKPARSEEFSFQALKANRVFHKYFKDLVKVNSIELGAYDFKLFIELGADTGVENDYIEQLGVMHDDTAYVKLPLKGQHSNDYYLLAVAYYVGQLLGAQPHLDGHGYPEFPDGFAQPGKQPRFPQVAAELMGLYVPVRPFEIQRINNLGDVLIGPQTAYEFGWISSEKRDQAYAGMTR